MTRCIPHFILLCLLSSCSSAFHREWKAAVKAGPASNVEGAWEGTWASASNGHQGKLRCVVGPAKNAQGDHAFHYHATWMRILSGAYRADHRVVSSRKGESTFTGKHEMPKWAGGLYTYSGTTVGDSFSACYECAIDKGSYQMQRVK